MKRSFIFGTVAAAAVVMLGAGGVQASTIFIGTVADWAATPTQVAADKTFFYLGSSGSWSGLEELQISSNIPQNSETLSISSLSDYIGPQNLMLAYQVTISSSSSDVFATISLDHDFSGATATTYKDIFASLADLENSPTPGSGTWALSLINAGGGSTVALPGLKEIFIRDTITLSPSGSVLSVSNTMVQVVPEPDMVPATACLAGGSMLVAWLARWRRTRRATQLSPALAH